MTPQNSKQHGDGVQECEQCDLFCCCSRKFVLSVKSIVGEDTFKTFSMGFCFMAWG